MIDGKAKIIIDEKQNVDGTLDSLENLVAGLGAGTDKRAQSRFVNRKMMSADGGQEELNAIYRTDWLAGKIVDIIPNDMVREWRTFVGDINPSTVEILEIAEADLALRSAFGSAHKWARLYGTAFILLVIDDGLNPSQPVQLDRIKKGSLKHIKVIDRHRVSNSEVVPIQDPLNPKFGFPDFYRINETSVRIHHTRLIRFDGTELPFDEFRRNNYNSDSVIERLYGPLLNHAIAADSAAAMIFETNVDIVKIRGLMDYIQTAEGESLIRKRFALASSMKSFNNMLLLDEQETFETKSNTFAGLPDLLDRFAQYLSSASDIPATRLLGQNASGLRATGEGDLKNYYDMIRSLQVSDYRPKLKQFDDILIRHLGLNADDDYKFEFNSLFQMTDKEKSEIHLSRAQRDQIYLDNDIVTPKMVLKDLQQTDTYTNITDDDVDGLPDHTDASEDFAL